MRDSNVAEGQGHRHLEELRTVCLLQSLFFISFNLMYTLKRQVMIISVEMGLTPALKNTVISARKWAGSRVSSMPSRWGDLHVDLRENIYKMSMSP